MVHLWNMGLEESQRWMHPDTPTTEKKSITSISFNFWLTEKAREKAVTLEDGTNVPLDTVSSILSREVLQKLAGSWSSYFELKKKNDHRARPPRVMTENRFQALSWTQVSVKGDSVLLPGADGNRLEIILPVYLQKQTEGKEVTQVTLSQREGIFYLNLVVVTPLPAKVQNPTFFRAIDLGAGALAVSDSDGSEFLIPARRPDKYWMPKIAEVEARQQGVNRESNRGKRLAKARRAMHNISHAQKNSHQRKLANALVEEKVHCIVIGKGRTRLGLAQSTDGTANQHYGAQNTGYLFRLLRYIKEKAAERGVWVVELPDPKRKGHSGDVQSKFLASRELLAREMERRGVKMPQQFKRKKFAFFQG